MAIQGEVIVTLKDPHGYLTVFGEIAKMIKSHEKRLVRLEKKSSVPKRKSRT